LGASIPASISTLSFWNFREQGAFSKLQNNVDVRNFVNMNHFTLREEESFETDAAHIMGTLCPVSFIISKNHNDRSNFISIMDETACTKFFEMNAQGVKCLVEYQLDGKEALGVCLGQLRDKVPFRIAIKQRNKATNEEENQENVIVKIWNLFYAWGHGNTGIIEHVNAWNVGELQATYYYLQLYISSTFFN
nr:hypothetical protein [Candidatus Sigynarchaeota archaeon]